MKHVKIITIYIFMISCNVAVFAQSAVNYYPKLLSRELNALGMESNSMEELVGSSALDQMTGKGKYFINKSKNGVYYTYVGRVNTCRAGGCRPDNKTNSSTGSEYFDYFILFNNKGIVQKVRIFNYQATHGVEITAAGWLNQFEGYDGTRSLSTGKKVDAISGATISVTGIIFDVEQKTRLLHSILSQQLHEVTSDK